MKNKTIIITTVICLLPMVLAAVIYDQLPNQVAIHFDSAGNPDNYAPKALAAFGLPGLLAIINLYTNFRINTEPKVKRTAPFFLFLSKWLCSIMSVIMVPITLFMAIGKDIPIGVISVALAGVLIIITGNYMPKCKRNYSVGIKLPWTLNSEENWNHTHRFAGFVWTIGGLVMVVNSFVMVSYLVFGVIIAMVTLPFIYSFIYYCKEKEESVES